MKIAPAESLVVFALAGRKFALGVSAVMRIVRAVEITPMAGAPVGVLGVINVEGNTVSVFDPGWRFGLPARGVRTTDHLVLARPAHGIVAVLVDTVVGIVPRMESVTAVSAECDGIAGAEMLEEGIIYIHDIDRFLSPDSERVLDGALKG